MEAYLKKSILSKHPYDWGCHFVLCFLYTAIGLFTIEKGQWFVISSISVFAAYVEYLQKSQVWYNDKSWWQYFIYDSLGDLIADGIGIILAMLLKEIFC